MRPHGPRGIVVKLIVKSIIFESPKGPQVMEIGDEKLSNLRADEIQNIEHIRIAKVNIWRFIRNDEVEASQRVS